MSGAQRDVWEAVKQPATTSKAAVSVALTLKGRTPGAPVHLVLSLRCDVAERLGWQAGTKLGLAIGTSGRVAGWLRIAPDPTGVGLFAFGRKGKVKFQAVMLARFDPGEDLARWNGPRMEPEFRELPADKALLCRIPWEFDDAEAADDTAEAA